MKFSLRKIIILTTLTCCTPSLYAGDVCNVVGNGGRYSVFYDNSRSPSLTLTLGQRPSGSIAYKEDKAEVTWHCNNNTLSIKWNTPTFKGNMNGNVGLSSSRSVIFSLNSGEINDRPFPFSTLSTRIYGSGGGI